MITRVQAERLAAGIHAWRPDWPLKQLVTLITDDLADYPLRDLAVALAYIALDQHLDGTWVSQTPYRVKEQGPWLTAGPTDHQIRREQEAARQHRLDEIRIREQAIAHCQHCDDRGYLNGARCPHEQDLATLAQRAHARATQARANIKPTIRYDTEESA